MIFMLFSVFEFVDFDAFCSICSVLLFESGQNDVEIILKTYQMTRLPQADIDVIFLRDKITSSTP